jgi:hypothetical protein
MEIMPVDLIRWFVSVLSRELRTRITGEERDAPRLPFVGSRRRLRASVGQGV